MDLHAAAVTRRRSVSETGVALGAAAGNVCSLVLRQAAILTGAGLPLGLFGSAMFARLTAGLLYGVTTTNPVHFVVVSLTLRIVALLAITFPPIVPPGWIR